MKRLLLFLLPIVFFISLISAQTTLGTFAQNSTVNLMQVCDNCTYVNVTSVLFPNSSFALSGQNAMTQTGNIYNYSFSSTSTIGTYQYTTCGDLDGDTTCNSVDFTITASGAEITEGSSIIILGSVLLFFILGVLSLIGMMKVKRLPVKWTMALLGFMAFLIGLNLISVLIADTLINERVVSFFDSFTAISFIMFWAVGAFIIIMWIFTFFQTIFYRNLLRKMRKYG